MLKSGKHQMLSHSQLLPIPIIKKSTLPMPLHEERTFGQFRDEA
jgi:hypothetical protein